MYTENNTVTFVQGGRSYFDQLLELIASAKETLHLQTYIYADDDTGELIAKALIEASRRNVAVFLLVDGYASQRLSKDFISTLKSSGIQFRFFEPLYRSRRFYLGRRLHHKIAVADLSIGLVGGINVANHYNDRPYAPAWLDFALRVEGEIVRELLVLCQKTWNGFQILQRPIAVQPAPTIDIPNDQKKKVRLRRNDWVRRKYDITLSYLEIFNTAKKEIIVISSYFLPGTIFRKAIRRARLRGVEITIIMASISDVKVAKMAERYMYEWLLSLGVKLYEYNKTVLHGKLTICDDKWFTLGSFNVNDISTYASVELNLDVDNSPFTIQLKEHVKEQIIPECTLISDDFVQTRTAFIRLRQRISFSIVRILFFFFTFYFKQIKESEN